MLTVERLLELTRKHQIVALREQGREDEVYERAIRSSQIMGLIGAIVELDNEREREAADAELSRMCLRGMGV